MRSKILIGATLCLALSSAWGKEDPDECQQLVLEGNAQEKAGAYAAAAVSFRGGVRAAEEARLDPCLLLSLNSLARVDQDLGRFSEAAHLYRRALAILKNGGHATSTPYAVILSNLGTLYVEDGQVPMGEAMLRESLTIYDRLLPADDHRLTATRNGLAEALMNEGKYQEAERHLQQALAILEKESQFPGLLAITLSNLAVMRRMQGRNQEAGPLLERSLAIMESENGRDHPALLRGLNNLAAVYALARRRDDADALFQRALALAEKYLGTNHPTYAAVLNNYAAFLNMNGRKAEARTLAAKAKDVLRDSARRNGLGLTVDASALVPK